MKYDKFLAFSLLDSRQHELFSQYFSPPGESSLFKNVPLDLVDEVKQMTKKFKTKNQRLVVKYRGPRYDIMRCNCRKRDARSAAIYLYENYQLES